MFCNEFTLTCGIMLAFTKLILAVLMVTIVLHYVQFVHFIHTYTQVQD